jgi:glycosyltransferase involved in cell wall biosynthesis
MVFLCTSIAKTSTSGGTWINTVGSFRMWLGPLHRGGQPTQNAERADRSILTDGAEPMRIAVWHNLPSGGGKRALYDHVQGLIARGHHVESWCPPTADQEFLALGELVPEHVVPLDAVDGPSWGTIMARLAGGGTRILARLEALDVHSQRCAREIDKGRFDVLLAGSCASFGVTGLARHVSCPTVLYLQEPHRSLYEANPRLPWLALPNPERLRLSRVGERLCDAALVRGSRIQARAELEGVQAYDRVLANSYFSRESILRAYGVDAAVCYLGVDTERYQDRGLPRRRLAVGIGAFDSRKRIEVIIEAIARIGPPRPDLIWIGNVASPDYLRELVLLAQRQRVPFTPRVAVSHEEVVQVLNEAAVMAYAPRLEPFGYAPLEAAACGLPVVSQAEGGVRETVVDGVTGLLVNHHSEFPPALERILDDEALARSMGTAGRRRVVSAWSLAAATDRLESHLLDVARGAGLPN